MKHYNIINKGRFFKKKVEVDSTWRAFYCEEFGLPDFDQITQEQREEPGFREFIELIKIHLDTVVSNLGKIFKEKKLVRSFGQDYVEWVSSTAAWDNPAWIGELG